MNRFDSSDAGARAPRSPRKFRTAAGTAALLALTTVGAAVSVGATAQLDAGGFKGMGVMGPSRP